MHWLQVLSRVAFVCNLFFLVSVSNHVLNWVGDEKVASTIFILGYFLGFVINPVTVFSYLVVLILKRKALEAIPIWLMVVNTVFLVIQLLFIIYLNDSRNY